jgi:basic membrane protein A
MRHLRASLAAFIATCVLLAAGCSPPPAPPSSSPTPGSTTGASPGAAAVKVGVVTDKGGKGDQSFNDSAIAGLERAAKDLGVEIKVLESRTDADYETNLESLADAKYDVIFGVGFAMTDPVKEVAAKYPGVKFALVDGVVEGPNVRSILFKEEEGSFLAGALAGLMTKSNKLGFIGGMKIPLIEKFEAGYRAGARTTNPNVTFLTGYTGKWDDPGKGKDLALTQFSQGADIIFHASGACGRGVIEAAKEKGEGFWAIGVDSDQDYMAPGRVLTSMIKRVDNSVFDTSNDVKGGKFAAGTKVYGLKEDGVGLSEMKHTKDKIPAEHLARVEALKAQIVAGEIVVPDNLAKAETFKAPAGGGGGPGGASPASPSPAASPDAASPSPSPTTH